MTNDKKETVNIIAHTTLDGLAIIGLVVLICLDKIETEYGLVMIALIVGIWGKMQSGTAKQPPSGLVAGMGIQAFELIRRMKGFVLPLAMVGTMWCAQGCGSTQMIDNINTALNAMITNPTILTVQTTCAAREWEAIQKSADRESAQSAVLEIRQECDRLYSAHDAFVAAAEKVQSAIELEQDDLVLPAFLEAQSAARAFLSAVAKSPIFKDGG